MIATIPILLQLQKRCITIKCATPQPHHTLRCRVKTTTWNIRLPPHIKEYFQEKGISPREILEQKYIEIKNSELPELLKEKEKLLSRVAQINEIMAQKETKTELTTRQKVVEYVKTSYKPEYFIGQTIEGIKITKEILEENI